MGLGGAGETRRRRHLPQEKNARVGTGRSSSSSRSSSSRFSDTNLARHLSQPITRQQPRFRSLWERYCRGVQAIVYVVDAADHAAVDTATKVRGWRGARRG